MLAYHATRNPTLILAGGFVPSTGGEFGPGVYFTERLEAGRFWAVATARGPEDATILRADVTLANPRRVRKVDWIKLTERSTPRTVQRRWMRQGHDGIIGVGINGIDEQIVVFNPESIRDPRVVERLVGDRWQAAGDERPDRASAEEPASAVRLQEAMDAIRRPRRGL